MREEPHASPDEVDELCDQDQPYVRRLAVAIEPVLRVVAAAAAAAATSILQQVATSDSAVIDTHLHQQPAMTNWQMSAGGREAVCVNGCIRTR